MNEILKRRRSKLGSRVPENVSFLGGDDNEFVRIVTLQFATNIANWDSWQLKKTGCDRSKSDGQMPEPVNRMPSNFGGA
jgi:hypothetical protein